LLEKNFVRSFSGNELAAPKDKYASYSVRNPARRSIWRMTPLPVLPLSRFRRDRQDHCALSSAEMRPVAAFLPASGRPGIKYKAAMARQ
jgi:hypothetical protein